MWVTTTHRSKEALMTHPNAPLTPEGRRRLAVLIVDEGWTRRRAAECFQCSPATGIAALDLRVALARLTGRLRQELRDE